MKCSEIFQTLLTNYLKKSTIYGKFSKKLAKYLKIFSNAKEKNFRKFLWDILNFFQ